MVSFLLVVGVRLLVRMFVVRVDYVILWVWVVDIRIIFVVVVWFEMFVVSVVCNRVEVSLLCRLFLYLVLV